MRVRYRVRAQWSGLLLLWLGASLGCMHAFEGALGASRQTYGGARRPRGDVGIVRSKTGNAIVLTVDDDR